MAQCTHMDRELESILRLIIMSIGVKIILLIWLATLGSCLPGTLYHEPRSVVLKTKRQLLPAATWGPYVDLGYTKSQFVKLSTIYTPGYPPSNNKGTIFLWPGLWDRRNQNQADLVQTVTEYYGSSYQLKNTCDPKPGEWVRAYMTNIGSGI
jgi:hypothetical protein